MKIVPLDKSYLSKVVALEQKCFSDPWTKEMFEHELESALAVYFAALDGEDVVGYAGMWKVLDEGHITNIAVSPCHRQKGIGTLLLKRLADEAKSLGILLLMLEVRKSNEAAKRLYSANGFVPVGVRKEYYSDNHEDAILMNFTIGEE